jgi:hypothetical protein
MGKPAARPPERFEKISVHGITVWQSNAVSPAAPGKPIRIDLGGWVFFGRRLMVRHAR